MKKTIAVDFDDVVMGFHNGFRDRHNRLYGTTLTYEQLVNYDNWEVLYGRDKDTMTKLALEFYHSPDHHQTAPIEGALEAIADLSQDYSLQIVTSRPETVREVTIKWIDQYCPGMFTDFHFTNIYAGSDGALLRSKAEVCRAIGAPVLIDDALRHARDVAAAGVTALLPDRPWNRSETPAGVHRMHSWREIVDWIKSHV